MPTVSKQQFKFMKGVESGSIEAPGLSKEKAAEFTAGQSPKSLPTKAKKKNKKKKAVKTMRVGAKVESKPRTLRGY